ncbi:MAG: hypothetical protein ABH891_05270 [Candidatus Omnitrophota bacterium]
MSKLSTEQLFKGLVNKARKYWDSVRLKSAYQRDYESFSQIYSNSSKRASSLNELGRLIGKWKIFPLQNPAWEFEEISPSKTHQESMRRFLRGHLFEDMFFSKIYPIFGTHPSFAIPVALSPDRNGDIKDQRCFQLQIETKHPKLELLAWLDYFLKQEVDKLGWDRNKAKLIQKLQDQRDKELYRREFFISEKERPHFFSQGKKAKFKGSLAELFVYSAINVGYSTRELEKEIPEFIRKLPRTRKTLSKWHSQIKRRLHFSGSK